MENSSNKNFLWIVIAVVVIALLAWWMLASDKAQAPVNDSTASTDAETADISAQLDGLNDADLNAEFKDIDLQTEQL